MFKLSKTKFAAALLTVLIVLVARTESVNAEGLQFRGFSTAKWKFDDKYSLDLEQGYYTTENFEDLKQFKNASGLTYYPAEWLALGIDYVVGYKNSDIAWSFFHGPRFSGKVKFEESNLKFSDRVRIEHVPAKSKPWQLRVKAKLKYTGFSPTQPFIADEVFISLAGGGLLKNRFYLGFTVPVLKSLDLDTFYILETVLEEEARNVHVLGLKANYRFR